MLSTTKLINRIFAQLAEGNIPRSTGKKRSFPLPQNHPLALRTPIQRSRVQAYVANGSLVLEGLEDKERVSCVGLSQEGIFYVMTDFPWRTGNGSEIYTSAHTSIYLGHERQLQAARSLASHYSQGLEIEKLFELEGKKQKLRILADGRLKVSQEGKEELTLERLV